MKNDYGKVPAKNNMEVGRDVDSNTDDRTNNQPVERPKFQGMVGTTPKKVKRSLLSRLITGLVGPDGASNIGGYVSEEIVKPAIKNIIVDAVTSGINMVMYGDRGNPNRNTRYSGGSGNSDYRPRTNYTNSYSQRPTERSYGREPSSPEPRRTTMIATNARYGVEEYVIEDRYDAAHVMTTLTECADRYGMVSVADYYDLIKVPSNFTDNSYGWRHDSITSARIVPARGGGYIIKFPTVDVL